MNTVALVLSVGFVLIVQALLIQRSLAARVRGPEIPPVESPAQELLWVVLPAILLMALLLYSLHHVQVI